MRTKHTDDFVLVLLQHTHTHTHTTLQSKIDKGVKVEFVLDLLFFLNLSVSPEDFRNSAFSSSYSSQVEE